MDGFQRVRDLKVINEGPALAAKIYAGFAGSINAASVYYNYVSFKQDNFSGYDRNSNQGGSAIRPHRK